MGTRAGTLTITYNAPDSPESASLSGTASATPSNCTKFVSPSGSDANNGTSGSPWQTLQKAFNSSIAGDVVCLSGGTYPTESTTTYSQIMNNSGVAGNPVTIQNFPGQVAIVKGNTRVNGAFITFKGASLTPPFGLVFQVGAAGLPLDGIDVLNTHGGESHYAFDANTAANSVIRNSSTFGVLQLTLHATSYSWQFVPVAGQTFTDSGTQACHIGA